MQDNESIITSLENAPALIIPLIKEVPENVIKRRPKPGKWSAHEHGCHLAEVHSLFFSRLELMLGDDNPRIRPYDPDRDMASQDALLRVNLDEALARFETDRRAMVERLKRLTADHWQRTAVHPEYSHYSIFIMFRHLALHDLLHAYRIEEILLKPDWEEEAPAGVTDGR